MERRAIEYHMNIVIEVSPYLYVPQIIHFTDAELDIHVEIQTVENESLWLRGRTGLNILTHGRSLL